MGEGSGARLSVAVPQAWNKSANDFNRYFEKKYKHIDQQIELAD